CEAGDQHYNEAYIRTDRALVRLARGDVDGALDDLWKGLARAREAGDPQAYVPTLAAAIRILVDAERLDEARPLADELRPELDSARGQEWMVFDAAWVADRVGLEHALREFARTAPSPWQERILAL